MELIPALNLIQVCPIGEWLKSLAKIFMIILGWEAQNKSFSHSIVECWLGMTEPIFHNNREQREFEFLLEQWETPLSLILFNGCAFNAAANSSQRGHTIRRPRPGGKFCGFGMSFRAKDCISWKNSAMKSGWVDWNGTMSSWQVTNVSNFRIVLDNTKSEIILCQMWLQHQVCVMDGWIPMWSLTTRGWLRIIWVCSCDARGCGAENGRGKSHSSRQFQMPTSTLWEEERRQSYVMAVQ